MQPSAGQKNILVFCRFYYIDDFRNNFSPVSDEYNFTFITDGHSPGTQDTREKFYAEFNQNARSDTLSQEEIDEIIIRCRYCRNVDRDLAERQVHAMTIAIRHFLDLYEPDAIISHMVDDYVGHIYALLAEKRGINFVGYAYSYFPGKLQLTHGWDGTAFNVREPGDEEVDAVFDTISERTYRQNYLQNSSYGLFQHLKLFLKHQAKYPVFGFRSVVQCDPYNYHYRVTPYLADRKNLFNYPLKRDFAADWQADLAQARKTHPDRRVLYLPLAYVPESTIDYWIPEHRAIDYEAFTLDALTHLSQSAILLVKEHVHMQGIRSRAFYKAISAIPNVVSVHPDAFSNNVLSEADAVIIGAGSVGVEATIRDKPVLSFGPGCYWFEASRAVPLPIAGLSIWAKQAEEAIAVYRALPLDEKKAFIRQCLRSTVRPRPGEKRWALIDLDDLRLILDQA